MFHRSLLSGADQCDGLNYAHITFTVVAGLSVVLRPAQPSADIQP
jgi:hypothetical protein